jgi:RimJ/RimL family protein N-acetyltransferase
MELEGDRVVLRGVQREDLEELWEVLDDLEVDARSSGEPPLPFSQARWVEQFEQDLGESKRDQPVFVIEVDGQMIGQIDLHNIDDYHGTCELGIAIGRDHWAQGYGQDAVRTLVDFAFRHLNLRKVVLYALADDQRAVGAYRAAGFEEEGRLREQVWFDGEYRDELVMSALRDRVQG